MAGGLIWILKTLIERFVPRFVESKLSSVSSDMSRYVLSQWIFFGIREMCAFSSCKTKRMKVIMLHRKKCKYDDEWDVKFTLLRYSKIVKKSLPILHVWPCIQKAKKCNHNSNLNVSFFNMGLNKISNLCLKYLQRLHWIHC